MGRKHMTPGEAVREVMQAARRTGATLQRTDACAEGLRLAARRLQQIGEWECNGYPRPGELDDKAAATLERFEETALRKAREAMAKGFGREWESAVTLHRQGDPRGPALVLTPAGECDQGSNRVAVFW